VGAGMILPSTPKNGWLLIILALLVYAPFIYWGYINPTFRKWALLINIVVFVIPLTQLNFKNNDDLKVNTSVNSINQTNPINSPAIIGGQNFSINYGDTSIKPSIQYFPPSMQMQQTVKQAFNEFEQRSGKPITFLLITEAGNNNADKLATDIENMVGNSSIVVYWRGLSSGFTPYAMDILVNRSNFDNLNLLLKSVSQYIVPDYSRWNAEDFTDNTTIKIYIYGNVMFYSDGRVLIQ
jgi:hypothetical protein